jgi:hypothetical protein
LSLTSNNESPISSTEQSRRRNRIQGPAPWHVRGTCSLALRKISNSSSTADLQAELQWLFFLLLQALTFSSLSPCSPSFTRCKPLLKPDCQTRPTCHMQTRAPSRFPLQSRSHNKLAAHKYLPNPHPIYFHITLNQTKNILKHPFLKLYTRLILLIRLLVSVEQSSFSVREAASPESVRKAMWPLALSFRTTPNNNKSFPNTNLLSNPNHNSPAVDVLALVPWRNYLTRMMATPETVTSCPFGKSTHQPTE